MPTTIATTDCRFAYTASGVGPYSFPRQLLAASDLKVRIDGALQTISTNYSVSLSGSAPVYDSATVTFVTAPTSGAHIEILRDIALTQQAVALVGGGVYDTLNVQFTRDEMKLQALADKVNRAPHVGNGAGASFDGLIATDIEDKAGYVPMLTGSPTPTGWTLGLPISSAIAVSAAMVPVVTAATLEDARFELTEALDGGSNISAAPSSHASEDSILTAFTGDMHSVIAVRRSITGAATGGQPSSGYYYQHEIFPHYTFLYNESGHNEATDDNDGRTGIVAYRTRLYHSGQGDLVAYNASFFIDSTRSGSTHFLANPAVVVLNGGGQAGVDGCYLNAGEFAIDDNSFDCAGIGWVVNLDRNDNTGAKSAVWTGYLVQSKGAARPNAMYSGTGNFEHGLNFTGVTFNTSQAAIVLKEGQRIYFEGTNSDPFNLDNGIVTGDTYITRDSGNSGFTLVEDNTTVAIVSTFFLHAPQKINTNDHYEVDQTTVIDENRRFYAADGAVGTPGLSFEQDQDSGLYRVGADSIGAAAGGTQIFRWGSTGIIVNFGSLFIQSGSAAAPGLRFGADTDLGVYRRGADAMGVASTELASVMSANEGGAKIAHVTQLLSAVSGATVTATNLIPAGARLICVTTRITTSLGAGGGTTGYTVGDGSDADRWGVASAVAAGTQTGMVGTGPPTADPSGFFAAAQSVVITAVGGNFDGTGAIRVVASYWDGAAPTS